MIAYNGFLSGLTKVHYGGHDLSMVYYGSHKVFPDETPPTGTKFFATYQDSSTYGVDCDGDSTLTTATTQNGGYSKYTGMTTAVIGNCVTSIGGTAFFSFKQLTSITIPDSVTSIGSNAFAYCNGLTSVNIPSSITLIEGNVFLGCTSLTSVTIPSGVTEIRTAAFQGCSGLTSITVEATTPPTLVIGGAFDNTNNCPIYVPAESVNAYKSATNWSRYASRIRAIQ